MTPSFKDILREAKGCCSKAELEQLRLAYEFAKQAHQGQKRKSGDPFFSHPAKVALELAKLKMDGPSICAALLHDVAEDTSYTLIDIEKLFGKEVCFLVMGVTKLGRIQYRGVKQITENLRKIFLSAAKDLRVIIIKLIDRLHNMETISVLPEESRKRIAQETLEIYTPIARRLGINLIRSRLEDLAFPYAYRRDYLWFQKKIVPLYAPKKAFIERVKKELKRELTRSRIKTIWIEAVPRPYFSLYQKLLRPKYDRDPSEIDDIVSLRVCVSDFLDCYRVLEVVHRLYIPKRGKIKDYIAFPRSNYYRSLHTTVLSQDGEAEVQICTPEMDLWAKYGILSHRMIPDEKSLLSRLTSGKTYRRDFPRILPWSEELYDLQKEALLDKQYLYFLKNDILQNRIFVFTPKGDFIELPENATPIDFAYRISSKLGNSCKGVKINNQPARLDTLLKNGDMVEILTDRRRKKPDQRWLKFVKTIRAKKMISSFYAKSGTL